MITKALGKENEFEGSLINEFEGSLINEFVLLLIGNYLSTFNEF